MLVASIIVVSGAQPPPSQHHVTIGFVTSQIPDATLAEELVWLKANRDAVDTVSATSYRFNVSADADAGGTVVVLDQWPTGANMSQDEVTAAVHALGMRTLPFVWEDDASGVPASYCNSTHPAGCCRLGRCLLTRLRALAANATVRATLIAQLVATAVQQAHAGYILDFETHQAVLPADNAAFAVFARELKVALTARGKVLQIGVSPGKPIYDMVGAVR